MPILDWSATVEVAVWPLSHSSANGCRDHFIPSSKNIFGHIVARGDGSSGGHFFAARSVAHHFIKSLGKGKHVFAGHENSIDAVRDHRPWPPLTFERDDRQPGRH